MSTVDSSNKIGRPAVTVAAESRFPLARPIEVRPALPPDGEIAMPIGYSQDPMVLLLDITAATLTLDRQLRFGGSRPRIREGDWRARYHVRAA